MPATWEYGTPMTRATLFGLPTETNPEQTIQGFLE